MPRRGNPMYAKYQRFMARMNRMPKCPVCGMPGSGLYVKKVISHGKVYKYKYFGHWKKGKIKWCYLKNSRIKEET